jgi:hypothetical protein
MEVPMPRSVFRFAILLTIMLVAGVASTASATYFPPDPDPNGEPSLKHILDTTYGAGNWSQLSSVSTFNSLSGTVGYKYIASYAADSHLFGYSTTTSGALNSGNFTSLFSVTGSPSSRTVSPGDSGTFTVAPGSSLVFVLNDTSHNNYFSTNSGQNTGIDPSNPDHVLAFTVNGMPNTVVLAFEDLTKDEHSDVDYNDLVVQVSFKNDCSPVPVPPSLLMLCLGAGSCAIYRFRLRKRLGQ